MSNMCGCKNPVIERYFGRQIIDSGMMSAYDQAGYLTARPEFTDPNPFGFDQELGFTGFVVGASFDSVAPEYIQQPYRGILPVKQQPKVEMPLPYNEAVVF